MIGDELALFVALEAPIDPADLLVATQDLTVEAKSRADPVAQDPNPIRPVHAGEIRSELAYSRLGGVVHHVADGFGVADIHRAGGWILGAIVRLAPQEIRIIGRGALEMAGL